MRTNPNGLNSEQAKSCLIMSTIGTCEPDRDARLRPVPVQHHESERDSSNHHQLHQHHQHHSGNQPSQIHNTNNDLQQLMSQSLIVQTPFRRIRHPELTPIMPRERDDRNFHGSEAENLMTQSLIMPPFRRMRHTELTPVAPRGRDVLLTKVSHTEPPKPVTGGPKRAFSMTRLDQLAKPRQRYLEEALRLRASVTKEPLVSPNRPTSSMSNANRLGVLPISGTAPYRPLASARKPRPLSIATPSAPENMMTSSVILPGSSATIERPSRSAIRAKLPFVTPSSERAQSAGSTRRQSVGSVDNNNTKPTPPRKPSQVKAASAARRMVKQHSPEADRPITKSSSTNKLNTITRTNTIEKIDKPKVMRKSATNPDGISVAAMNATQSSVLSPNEPEQPTDLNDIPERPNSETKSSIETDSIDTAVKPNVESNSTEGQVANAPVRKEVSQEEYRRALAEKRRLKREQAEREAEQERERIAKERAAEEERQKQLLEQLRQQEEEQRLEEERQRKLRLEYEEQQRKDAEEQQRLEEEARVRDEQERKNREKAEKARLELEERLRKDEEDRIARKKRLEAIMSRTRKTPNSTTTASPNSESAQTPGDLAKNFQQRLVLEQNQRNERLHNQFNDFNASQTPDVVEDAIKSNLINGKSELETPNRFVDNLLDLSSDRPIIKSNDSNGDLLVRYSEMSTTNAFVFTSTNSNETITPGTH